MNITLSCQVKEYVRVEPGKNINLSGFKGDRVKERITITSFEEEPLEITDITSTVGDKISYKLKTVEKGKQFTIDVETHSREEESFRGQIILKTTSRKKPHIMLPVYGNVKNDVAVLPKKLFFGTINRVQDGVTSQVFTKTATIRDVRGNGFTVKKVKSSCKWIAAEVEEQKEKSQYILRVTLDKDALPQQGLFNERVTLNTSYKGEPLVVQVSGEVM